MLDTVRFVWDGTKRVVSKFIEPLRKHPDSPSVTLSIPETQTTTVDGGLGWAQRPAAELRCPRCKNRIRQSDPRGTIDCQHCIAEFQFTEFTELELVFFVCPVCGDRMQHGNRHPQTFDLPEWATCNSCRYHWEFRHSFS